MNYRARNHIRIVTAAALFDGHDAAINIMRRLIQAGGAEVIHLGHSRSVREVVQCAIQEDVQGIALSSYQGGHMEYFKHAFDLLQQHNAGHIKLFGGGGGVILPEEIEELHACGITRIYSPEDGRVMGLQGMIDDLLARCDVPLGSDGHSPLNASTLDFTQHGSIARAISRIENAADNFTRQILANDTKPHPPVIGITGTGGAGKSSLIDELLRRLLLDYPDKQFAILSVDPSKRRTGGALLGDRIRMNAVFHPHVYMRSMATRQAHQAISPHVGAALSVLRAAGFDLIILESAGIGQSDSEIVDHADVSLYVMTPEYGAASQLEKIDMLEFADIIAINKFDKPTAEDALRDIKRQYRWNHQQKPSEEKNFPVFGTTASRFNDGGVNALYFYLTGKLNGLSAGKWPAPSSPQTACAKSSVIIPAERNRYLADIATCVRHYNTQAQQQSRLASQRQSVATSLKLLNDNDDKLRALHDDLSRQLDQDNIDLLEQWPALVQRYQNKKYTFAVRDKNVEIDTRWRSLSGTAIPKIALPRSHDQGELLQWLLQENLPGQFPFTAGLFPFKRQGEDPTRMFAGEGGPERTNRRFHYLSQGMPSHRLSTAFDSVTLYGHDPALPPDVYGKIGNAGVSICCLDDAKKLYSGFDLCNDSTSVSMTINGPAPMLLSFFLNAAIDQQCELYIRQQGLSEQINQTIEERYRQRNIPRPRYNDALPEGHNGLGLLLLGITGDQVLPSDIYQRIRADTFRRVRGTVQADILKEDQAQNTCIFSTEFALRLMGDVQQYFIDHQVRNFYSVSVSGYHMAEAGANPVTQLAFTLANGFTYVEYYLQRGMQINDFAPSFSFFFSNGLDAEYAVIGRVARRIWAKVMKHHYGANTRSQQLKYHVQTSGRSLHAQEIAFNDIRTTLQALYAIYDNCNSLHTNAYDEAITTPTEESVRRALAIQLIINRELGLTHNENPLQGSFVIDELTDLVEEAVLCEFERLAQRGGVLGAMETQYMRSKIQQESLLYEQHKNSGELPIIGVNTFVDDSAASQSSVRTVMRASEEEKQRQLETIRHLHAFYADESTKALQALRESILAMENSFPALMEAGKVCSLEQISQTLFELGGQYRRNV